jgi:hypothetical protein
MNSERFVFNDTPAFIPVPVAFQHRKVEVILCLLDEDIAPVEAPTSTWADFFKRYSRQFDDATPYARDGLHIEQTNFKGVPQ